MMDSAIQQAVALGGEVAGGRRVLILDFDLFGGVGGGQSAHRRIIALRAQDSFYYFNRREAAARQHPRHSLRREFLSERWFGS